ncbi:unnamed protein product, partial [Candidula unifasciata]
MSLTPDRQGYLGQLKDKNITELIELLERQEKILSKGKYLARLPDKGEKARAFAIHLKHLIEEKSGGLPALTAMTDCDMDPISDLHKSSISVTSNNHNLGVQDQSDIFAQIEVNQPRETTENGQTGSSENNEKNIVDLGSNLASSLEKMSLGGSNKSQQTDTGHYINSYERVIKQAEVKSIHKKPKFLPNRTLLHYDIPPSPYPQDTAPKKPEREEPSAANPPCYKFQKSQLIPIEESVKLIEQQRALNEELTTQRAARKLAEQLLPKMDTYAPASTDM